MIDLHLGDNLSILPGFADQSFDLIYIDPPFNTQRVQKRTTLRTVRDDVGTGDRTGFGGRRYTTEQLGSRAFVDRFDDFPAFLEPRLIEARRLLTPTGSLFVHLDSREVHYIKVMLDQMFGRASFINEIIWAYDYGGRSKTRWAAKHDTILWYARNPECYTFEQDAIDRIPYLAPGLVTPEKAARGKRPTDVWWHTIVATAGRERTGYPTQKPLGIIRRIVNVHSRPGDQLLDFFAGSGTFGEAAVTATGGARHVTLIDILPEAVEVMEKRLEPYASKHGLRRHGMVDA